MTKKPKEILRQVLPGPIIGAAKLTRKSYRRYRYRLLQRVRPVIVTKENIVDCLHSLGVNEGDGIMVHSSMSKFGQIDGGPRTVVEAMEEVVGLTGTIAMPAFPIKGRMKDHLEAGETFETSSTPSNMGALTEFFRTMPGVFRSVHPTHSVCAKGRDAKEIVNEHEFCLTPFGKTSPFEKMAERNFWLILFGVNLGPLTMCHVFEDRLGDRFPYKVYLNEVYKVRCLKPDGDEIVVKTLCHDPALTPLRIDNNKDKVDEFYRHFSEDEILRECALGKGTVMALRACDLLSELGKLLDRGISVFVSS